MCAGKIYSICFPDSALDTHFDRQDRMTEQMTGKPARFTLPRRSDHNLFAQTEVTPAAVDFISAVPWSIILRSSQHGASPNKFLAILYQLNFLTNLHNNSTEKNIHEMLFFEQRLNSIEQLLSFHILRAMQKGHLDYHDRVREACCISCSIYARIVFRDAGPHDEKLGILRTCLEDAIIKLDIVGCDKLRLDDEAPFLLWILFIGGILCGTTQNRAFFVSRIMWILSNSQIVNWDQMDLILRRYLWTEKLSRGTCWELWREVEFALTYNE
jgi:hypothetical protein